MGKVHFPLVNVRKDVTGSWHMHHYTNDTAETITVPEYSDENGYYTAFLTEIPDSGSISSLNTTPPRISGLVEYRGDSPIDPNTKRIKFTANQFYVNYQTGELMFSGSLAGQTLKVDYWGKGSLVEADDINALHSRLVTLENTRKEVFFTDFSIDKDVNLEVGSNFPSSTIPSLVTFKWKINEPTLVEPESIAIVNKQTGIKIIKDLGGEDEQASINFTQIFNFNEPRSLQFEITGVALSGDIFSKKLDINWLSRIYWLSSETRDLDPLIVRDNAQSILVKKMETDQKVDLNFLERPNQYKCIIVPKQIKLINGIIDKENGHNFIFSEPFDIVMTNEHGLGVLCNAFISAYPIGDPLVLTLTLEGDK